MHDQIEGEIKWRDADDRTQRKPTHHPKIRFSLGCPIERHHFAGDTLGLFSRDRQRLYRAIDLALRVGDRLPGLCRDGLSKFIPATIEQRRHVLKDIIAGVGGQLRHNGCGGH